ncbi:O-antigen ligase family protein [Streptomyces alboflavus]|uniref:O-antigen ligase family protein n=1 Tax=Streptomyces alboflavus TaxID=67267 RepID=UPI0036B8555D
MKASATPAAATTGGRAAERRGGADVGGMAILAVCAAWALITTGVRGGRPDGVLLAILAVAAGYAGGRVAGALLPVAAPCVGALAGVGLAAAAPHVTPGPVSSSPLGPIGATAALLSLAAGAACCAAWSARGAALRAGLRVFAAGIVLAAALLGSTAGVIACAGIVLCSLAAALVRSRGLGLSGFAVAAAVVTGFAWAVARGALPEGLRSSLEGQLGPYRVRVWQDAEGLAGAHPALGVGPGRFGDAAPSAGEGVLVDDKPHSALLQQGAEQGFVGVALLAAAFCWLLFALWRSPRPTQVVLSAGAALTALAGVATVGNALSVTSVTVGAGLLAGIATARPLHEEAQDTESTEDAEDAARVRPARSRGGRGAPG